MPRFSGWVGKRHYVARTKKSRALLRTCECCGRPVRRSHRTGILWSNCFRCRYLKMVYGPNIEVRYHPNRKEE